MDGKNNNSQENHPNSEAVMAEYRAGVAKLQNILTSSQASVDFRNKMAASVDQAAARLQTKLSSGQLETLSPLPKNLALPVSVSMQIAATQQAATQAVTDSLNNPNHSAMQAEAMKSLEEALNNPHLIAMQAAARQTVAETANNPHLLEMYQEALKTALDSTKNPYLEDFNVSSTVVQLSQSISGADNEPMTSGSNAVPHQVASKTAIPLFSNAPPPAR